MSCHKVIVMPALLVSLIHPASAEQISLEDFTRLATKCAPKVHLNTLAAVAKRESGFDSLAMLDNTAKKSYKSASITDALMLANDLITRQGHSVDLGIMQINSRNFLRLGLSIGDAFKPCQNMAAGARILVEGYTPPAAEEGEQAALHASLSRYNTGSPTRGIANGYVRKVQASAEIIVPAIRTSQSIEAPVELTSSRAPVFAQPLPPRPPFWDVYGQALALRRPVATAYAPGTTIVTATSQGNTP